MDSWSSVALLSRSRESPNTPPCGRDSQASEGQENPQGSARTATRASSAPYCSSWNSRLGFWEVTGGERKRWGEWTIRFRHRGSWVGVVERRSQRLRYVDFPVVCWPSPRWSRRSARAAGSSDAWQLAHRPRRPPAAPWSSSLLSSARPTVEVT